MDNVFNQDSNRENIQDANFIEPQVPSSDPLMIDGASLGMLHMYHGYMGMLPYVSRYIGGATLDRDDFRVRRKSYSQMCQSECPKIPKIRRSLRNYFSNIR